MTTDDQNPVRGRAVAARIALEVTAGLIPGRADAEHTRRWVISDGEWKDARGKFGGHSELLADRNGRALGYASLLMLQPDRINWVRVDWIYF